MDSPARRTAAEPPAHDVDHWFGIPFSGLDMPHWLRQSLTEHDHRSPPHFPSTPSTAGRTRPGE